MAITIVELGSERLPDEGLRIGTVRRPPRGVRSEDLARGNWYDVWFPNLAPTPDLVKEARAAQTDDEWRTVERKYRREMAQAGPSRDLDLLAALSHGASFSVGCYCANEARCHRSLLRALLAERGARIV